MIKTGKDHVDYILNDIEKAQLQAFIDNPTAVQAVKKVLLKAAYFEGVLVPGEDPMPARNAALSFLNNEQSHTNEVLGQQLRALIEAVRLVEQGFNYLENYKTNAPKEVNTENPAR